MLVIIVQLIPLGLLFRGRLSASSIITLVIYIGAATLFATREQGIRDYVIMTYPSLIMFAGLTYKRRGLTISTLLTLIALSWLILGEINGWFVISMPFDTPNLFDLIMVSIMIVITSFGVFLLVSNLENEQVQVQRELAQRLSAEKSLYTNRQNLQALIENLDGIIWSIDSQYRLVIGNSLYHRNTSAAIGREFAEGENLLALDLPQAALDEWQGYYDRALQGEKFSIEVRTRFTPHPLDVEYRFSPILTEDGEISGVTIFGRDITERKRVEEALRESHEDFQRYFNISTIGVAVTTPEKSWIEVNERLCQILGYTKEELVKLTWGEITHPDDLEANVQLFNQMMAGEIDSYQMEKRYIRKDRSVVYTSIYASCHRNQDGTVRHLLTSVIDITERKQAEETLRKSEERYQNFITQSFEGISRTEFDNPINITLPIETQIDLIYENAYMAECNQALANMYNAPSPQAFIGTRLVDAHKGKDNPINRAAFKKFIENGYKSVNDETIEYTANGKPVWFLSNTIGTIENGHLIRLWGTTIDITERKQAEEALRESREDFQRYFNMSTVGMAVSAPEKGWLEVNEYLCQMLGYSRKELIKTTWVELTHPDDLDANLNLHNQTLTGKIDSYQLDKRFIRKDGAVVAATIFVTCHRNPDSTVRYFLTSFINITERKQAEEALRESQNIFSSFLENSPIYVFFKDKDIRTLRLSRNYEQMLGMPIEQAIGKTMDELFPSDLAKSMVTDDLRIMDAGRRIDIVEELNGRIYETTKFPIYKDGKPNMLAGFTIDITDRKLAESALRESEENFRQLITSAPDAIFGVDKEGKIVFANEQATILLGYSSEELLGKNVNILVPMNWHGTHNMMWEDYVTHPNTGRMGNLSEPIVVHKDGREIPVDIKLSHSNTTSGMLIIAYMRDMTERKNTETQLRIANSQLETQMRQIQGLQLILREQSIRDPLTNLYNRRYLSETLQRDFERIKREKSSLSIIIMDIDHFKNINDAFGHQAGDEFLMVIAKILGKKARNSDIICRYGGEEFLLVLPDTSTNIAANRAEEIRLLCSETRMKYKKNLLSVTLSFGVATYPSHGLDPNEIITKADEALYRSKKSGRNCVTIWQDEDLSLKT